MKTGRNQLCPCGSGSKYKRCCQIKGIDPGRISYGEWIRNLSIRGKNILFVNKIAEALNLDKVPNEIKSFWDFVGLLKRAITPRAVREIHLAIPELWPDGEDLTRCLEQEKNNYSGLFLGSYLFDVTVNLLNRHAMYNQSIILIDPFHDPRVIAPKYNPIENPEEHITTTFHYVLLWLQLMPWIEAGIVKIIRNPGDFNYELRKSTFELSNQKVEKYPELQKALENQERPPEFEEFFKESYTLAYSDDFWVDKIRGNKELSEEFVRDFFKTKREQSLYYVDTKSKSQLLFWSTGTNYEMGKYICEKTNSHIITDFSYRWLEMAHDRKINDVEIDAWATFAKAFQESPIKHLDGLVFNDLLRIRNDGYLEGMRAFLRRAWSASSSGEAFSKNDVENLSAELIGQIDAADAEWAKIDANLFKWFGSESILGSTIGVATGVASWIPAVAIAGAGVVNLAQAAVERKTFLKRYPAGFFIDRIRKKT